MARAELEFGAGQRTETMKKTIQRLAIAFFLLGVFVSYGIYAKRAYIWLPAYVMHSGRDPGFPPPTDIILLIADHYEPADNGATVAEWLDQYPRLFSGIKDSDGRPPRHTFFYPAEQFRLEQLQSLNELVRAGYGEIELHLHHKNDTSATLREKIRQAKRDFAQAGALQTPDGQPHFGFVHGNWALDNSVGNGKDVNLCGVNDEMNILREEGAYADFTFPAYETTAQPPIINQIYYAWDDPAQPKSYATGKRVEVGVTPAPNAFMLIEGPTGLRWFTPWYRPLPVVEYGGMEGEPQTAPDFTRRFRTWMAADVHVQGRPEWVFIKWHTHGGNARDKKSVLSPQMADLYRKIVDYGRQHNIRVHFVTAREAYNMVKAAEAGRSGDPNAYRDFLIPPYANASPVPAAQKAAAK